jgi:hypothetical protein
MANEGTNDVGKQIVLAVAIMAGGVLVFWGCSENQFFHPTGHKVPVVPQLPAIAAEMRRAKSLCEGRAREVKAGRTRRLITLQRDLQGRQLYTDTKVEFDGCITFLCVAMDRKFVANDSAEIEKQLKQAEKKMAAFLKWYDSSHPRIGAENLLDQIPELMVGLVKFLKEADDKIREELKKELKDCSFRDWGDIPDK